GPLPGAASAGRAMSHRNPPRGTRPRKEKNTSDIAWSPRTEIIEKHNRKTKQVNGLSIDNSWDAHVTCTRDQNDPGRLAEQVIHEQTVPELPRISRKGRTHVPQGERLGSCTSGSFCDPPNRLSRDSRQSGELSTCPACGMSILLPAVRAAMVQKLEIFRES